MLKREIMEDVKLQMKGLTQELIIHGPHDLSLSLKDDCVVEVALVDSGTDYETQELPKEVGDLTNRPDLSEQQQEELHILLLKWEKVFSKYGEHFGRTDLVQHCVHTSDAAPEVSTSSSSDVQRDEDVTRRYARERSH